MRSSKAISGWNSIITLFSLASFFPLRHVKTSLPWLIFFFYLFGCIAVKLSACSPVGENIRSSTVAQRTPHVAQALFPLINYIHAFPIETISACPFCLIILRRNKGMCLSRDSSTRSFFFYLEKVLQTVRCSSTQCCLSYCELPLLPFKRRVVSVRRRISSWLTIKSTIFSY